MPDDYSANVRTTGAVEVGGSATGKIETAGDVDWFKVPVTAGKIYRVVITPSPEDGNGSRNPYRFEIHDGNGNSESETHTGWAGLRLPARPARSRPAARRAARSSMRATATGSRWPCGNHLF